MLLNSKIYKVVLPVTIITLLTAIAILVFTFFEKSPIEYTNQPFPVSEEKVYVPGDTLRLVITRCVSKPIEYSITQSFVNDNPNADVKVYYLESQNVIVQEAGCVTVLGIPKTIPAALPSGSYHIEHGVSTNGRFRDFFFTIKSQSFEVKNENPTPITPINITPYTTQTTQTNTTTQVPVTIISPGTTTVIKETTTKETKTTTNNNTKEKETVKEVPKDNSNDEDESDEPVIPSVIDDATDIIKSIF